MDFVIRKTTELTEEEIFSFCQLFEEVFVGHVKSVEYFKREFLNTSLGYSYHALMFDGNKMVGANSLIPCDYVYKGEHVLMAFSVDTMIKKGYRDFFNLKDLIDLIEDEARKTGIFFVFGFPNDNAYPILKKGIKYKDIGKMYTYVLPYRIGGIKPCFFFLNPLSKLFCKCLIKWSLFVANHKSYFAMIDRERETFNTYRYKWFEQDYCKVNLDNFSFIYRIKKHEGVRTAFLLDINCISFSQI